MQNYFINGFLTKNKIKLIFFYKPIYFSKVLYLDVIFIFYINNIIIY